MQGISWSILTTKTKMSGEAAKESVILQSALTNGGSRTVLQTHLLPSATVFPHFHNNFSETFKVLSGSISVYMSPDISSGADIESDQNHRELATGESATVRPKMLHKYIVNNSQSADIQLTFEPGSLDFERGICILTGIQKDNPESIEGNMGLLAVIAELTDANPVGNFGEQLDQAKLKSGWHAYKTLLLQKYAKDEDILAAVKEN